MVKEAITSRATKGESIETEYGSARIGVVKASMAKIYTDATVTLIEDKELLSKAAVIEARLKADVTSEEIPDADLEVLSKYGSNEGFVFTERNSKELKFRHH